MKPVIIINTFKQIFFDQNKKPIVICDIDHTFIRPLRNYNDLYNELKDDCLNNENIDKNVNYMLEMSIKVGLVKQTDQDGFLFMLERINQLGGKLVFLTARSKLSHKKTIKDLEKACLKNPESYEIHYTENRITKGEYIKNNNLLNGYDQAIFIDDYPHFLQSALKIYPDMDCYLFKYNI
jgi:predicted secreted acid phosphatase